MENIGFIMLYLFGRIRVIFITKVIRSVLSQILRKYISRIILNIYHLSFQAISLIFYLYNFYFFTPIVDCLKIVYHFFFEKGVNSL